jgi:hypothetical protein
VTAYRPLHPRLYPSPSGAVALFRTMWLVTALAILQILAPTMVGAEPITVTRGMLAYTHTEGAVLIDWGGDEFATQSFGFADDRFRSPPGLCRSCKEGELFSPGGVEEFDSLEGGLIEGSFTLGERTYQMLRGSATFVSPDVMVPPPGPPEEFFSIASSPFRYHGFFEGESSEGERVRVDLVGRGTASVLFDYSDGSARWFSSIYQFSDPTPIPEPTSVLLLSVGLAAGFVRRLRIGSSRPCDAARVRTHCSTERR